jgi:hypothetical protein
LRDGLYWIVDSAPGSREVRFGKSDNADDGYLNRGFLLRMTGEISGQMSLTAATEVIGNPASTNVNDIRWRSGRERVRCGQEMKNDEAEADKVSMRLKDLRLASELLAEAVKQENGARERIAERYCIQKSVITDRVKRMEQFFNVKLFTGAQRKTPTEAGKVMAVRGPQLMGVIELFTTMLRDASEPRRSLLEESGRSLRQSTTHDKEV